MPNNQIKGGYSEANNGQGFILGQTVTAESLNAIAEDAILLPGAVGLQSALTPRTMEAADEILMHDVSMSVLRKAKADDILNSGLDITADDILANSVDTDEISLIDINGKQNSSGQATDITITPLAGKKVIINGSVSVVGDVTVNGDSAVPCGAVLPFAMQTPPQGWLRCNGNEVSRTTYSRLFSAIGTTYGAGDGSTTFKLPDLRGEFIRGHDDSRGVDVGRTFGSSQGDLIRKHKHVDVNHNCTDYTNHNGIANGKYQTFCDDGSFQNNGNAALTGDGTHGAQTGDGGGTSEGVVGEETRPRNVALNYCIKF